MTMSILVSSCRCKIFNVGLLPDVQSCVDALRGFFASVEWTNDGKALILECGFDEFGDLEEGIDRALGLIAESLRIVPSLSLIPEKVLILCCHVEEMAELRLGAVQLGKFAALGFGISFSVYASEVEED